MQTLLFTLSASALAFTIVLTIGQIALGGQNRVRRRVQKLIAGTAEDGKTVKRRKVAQRPEHSRKSLINLSVELAGAGIRLKVEEFVLLWFACAFCPAGVCMFFGGDWIAALGLLLFGVTAPIFVLRRRKIKRMQLLENQLSNALIIMSNCLQTGLSFQQALESIVREMPEPISREFGRVVREVQYGLTLEQSLENMANRLNSPDFMLVVSAVLIQRQVGGNLSEVLGNISDTIRERVRIRANLKVLTATGRTSGMVIGLMPVFLMLVLMVINPSYVRMFFTTSVGIILFACAGALEIIGFLAIKRVLRVTY